MQKSILKTLGSIIKRVLQIISLFVLVIGIFVVIVGSMLGVSMVSIAKQAPKINAENIILSLSENSKILDKDGKLIESLAFDEYREIVKYKDIPKQLVDAIISIEDERFESHKGVSIRGVLRSFISNLSAGDIVQGGSTITQQLVKNVYLSPEVKWERKITEMYLALKLEEQLSKEEIMEAYLNRVFLGQHSYGIEAAAQTYFSKSVKDLTLAQSATLAAIVQAPSSYALFYAYQPATVPEDAEVIGDINIVGMKLTAVKNPAVMERKDIVLRKMLELGKITQKEYDDAIKEDVMASVKPGSKVHREFSSQISSLIKEQAIEIIMKEKETNYEEAQKLLYTGGLEVYTTIDWEAQRKLEEAYEEFTSFVNNKLETSNLGNLNYDDNEDIVDSDGNKLYYKKSNLLTEDGKLYLPEGWYKVEDNGDLTITSTRFSIIPSGIYVMPFYQFNDKGEFVSYRVSTIDIPREFLSETNDGFVLKANFFKQFENFYKIVDGNLVIDNAYYFVETEGTVQPQSATIILDSKTAEIVAVVGARGNSKDDTINRATNFTRPPGSTMKPIAAYAPAIENGRTLASPIDDTPFQMLYDNPWPRNAYSGYYGVVTVREALEKSMNPPAIKLMNELGIDTALGYLGKFGIINEENPEKDNFVSVIEDSTDNDVNIGTAMGSMVHGLTVKEIAGAYQTFANGGERIPVSIISKIKSKDTDLYVNKHIGQRVISEETNFLITDVLKNIANLSINSGTTNDFGIETAGKTGTSSNDNDYWFAGYNPYYTAATWIGFDNSSITLKGNSGLAGAFFGSYMNKLLDGKEAVQFSKPDTIVTANVSRVDGLLPSELTKSDPRGNMIYTEYFKEGTVPSTQSNAHVKVKIDKRNNLLANENTPKFLVEEKVFVNRPIKYDPNQFNGIEPADWKYAAPTKISTLPWKEEVKKTTLEDGSIQEVVQKFNGDIEVKITKPDGTIILQVKTLDGKVTTTVTKPVPPETKKETQRETQKETTRETQPETDSQEND